MHKKVILIYAHKNLELLNDLIGMLASDEHVIYVNIDQKANFDIRQVDRRVKLIRHRIRVEWGRFSQVQATINALREIERHENDYEHIIFISGQDYPLVSNQAIDAALVPGRDYLPYRIIAENEWDVGWRFEKFNFGNQKFQRRISWIFNGVLIKTNNKRHIPYNYVPYGGSCWWMLTKESVQYFLDFVDRNWAFVNFYRCTSLPDEMFFHTILINSQYSNKVVNNNFHYVDWSERKFNPKILGLEDYEKIISSGNLFCRKVDLPFSKGLIERLKEKIKSDEINN